MKKSKTAYLLLLLFLITGFLSQAQNQGFIDPQNTFTNTSSDTLFFTTMDNFDKILGHGVKLQICQKKVSLFEEQVATMNNRIFTSDSAIALRSAEADFWKMKLETNDLLLEQQRIENLHLNDKNRKLRNSRLYFFVGGILASSVVFLVVK